MIVPLVAWGGVWRKRAKRCIASLGNDPRIVVYTDKPEEFEVSRPLPKGMGKHKINNACYRLAREEFKQPLAPIAADMVCSIGILDVLEDHSKSGKRLVSAPVPRVKEFEPAQSQFSSRELAKLAIERLHKGMGGMFWGNITRIPTTVFRKHGSGLIANCFHAHPVLFDAEIGNIDSLDGLGVKDIPNSETHVITDSDEALVVDFSDEKYDWDEGRRASVAKFAAGVLPKHRWIFGHDCHIHFEDIPQIPTESSFEDMKAHICCLS